jgi:putative DNA primase/helicase
LGEANVSTVALADLGKRFQLIGTLGKLVNLCTEVDNVRDLDEAVLKQFTGEDPMQFEQKFEKVFSAMPTAKLIISGNSRLPFKDRSEGIWRRLVLLYFPINIPADRENKNLTRDLSVELSGIFNWAVDGLRRLRSHGTFSTPSSSQTLIADFRYEANNVWRFLDERYVEVLNGTVGSVALYGEYKTWCFSNGYQPLNQDEFGREVLRKHPAVKKGRCGSPKITKFIGLGRP